jgi:hypothetical protein
VLKSESTTINGNTYEVTQLPYTLGQRLLMRLIKTLGPAFADALAQAPDVDPGTDLMSVNITQLAPAIGAAVRAVTSQLSEADLDFAVATLAEYSKIKRPTDSMSVPLKGEMEFHYAGNYAELAQWLGFALKVNYGGFFRGQGSVADLLAKLQAARPKVSPSPSS